MASNSNPIQKKQSTSRKPSGSGSSSPRFSYLFLARLLVLLSILLGLAFYAWRSSSYRSAIKSAELLISNERNREASKALNAIKDAYGENAQLRLLLAKTYRQAGKQDQFMRELELAEPLGLELATVQGEKLLFDAQSGTLPNVRADVGQWLESHPQEFEDAGRSIAFGLLRKEDFDGVNNFLSTWQQQSPGSPRIAWFRSMIHLARREWKKALSELEPALKEHPDFLPFYLNAGTAYSGDQQFEKAEAAFEKYLAKEPEEWDAWLKYSEVLRKLGKANDALKKLQPIAQNPGLPPSLRLQLGKLYLEAGDHQKTIDTVLGLAQKWPEDIEIASTLSQAYQRLGDEPRAMAYATIADAGQKETENVEKILFELMNNPQKTPQQCYDLGHLLLHKKSRENGVYWLQAALKLDQNFLPAHEDLALYYERSDQPRLAELHRKFVSLRAKK